MLTCTGLEKGQFLGVSTISYLPCPHLRSTSATRLAITTNDKVVLGNALLVSVRLPGSLGADAMDWFWWAVKPVENGPTVVALSPSSMRQGQGALNEHQISVIG